MTSASHEPSKPIVADDGSDIIFITGAPGSKWSLVAQALSFADEVNISDVAAHRVYGKDTGAVHFGNYFGPGMEYGARFDRMSDLDKLSLMREFSRPYSSADGVKLIKSHMFARHLEFLVRTFPAARFVLVYRTDDACLDWWLEAGGFDISFPDYSWYGEIATMKEQISLDNQAILEFVEQNQLRLKRLRSLKPVFEAFGLGYSPARLVELASGEPTSGFALESSDPEDIQELLLRRAVEAKLTWFTGIELDRRG